MQSNSPRGARTLLLVGTAFTAFVNPASGWAQEAQGADPATAAPTEIVVTARGREQRLQDVPVCAC